MSIIVNSYKYFFQTFIYKEKLLQHLKKYLIFFFTISNVRVIEKLLNSTFVSTKNTSVLLNYLL